jgi:hypothetical protein
MAGELQIVKNLAPSLTAQETQIVIASKGKQIKDIGKLEVANKVMEYFGAALLVLNHSKMDVKDRGIMQQQIVADLYDRFSFFTLKEVENAFYMGSRGLLKSKPEEVVFMSIAQVYQWLYMYRVQVKREAMKKQIEFEAKQEEQDKEKKISENVRMTLQMIREQYELYLEGKEPHDPINVLYDFMDKRGLVKLSDDRKKEIYKQATELYKNTLPRSTVADFMHSRKILSEMEQGTSRIKATLKGKAKELALKEVFQDIKESGMTIEEYFEGINDKRK